MKQLKHSRHNVGGCNHHIQLTPKYRRQVFLCEEIRRLIEALFRLKAFELGIRIGAINFGPDHMHVFLMDCNNYSVATLVQHLKGFSSHYIRTKRPDLVRPYLWGKSFWSDGYFSETIGRCTNETMVFYIERQQGKHWEHEDIDAPSGVFGQPSGVRQVCLDSFGG